MSAPQPSPAEDGEDPDEAAEPQGEAPEDPEEADEVEVDLAETNLNDEIDEAFDAIENAERPNAPDDPTDNPDFDPFNDRGGSDDEDGGGGSSSGGEASGEDIADAIVEGTSRLAVLGLEEEFIVNGETKSKTELREEFAEIFTAFRLGEYGGQVAEEYLFVDEDIDPVMGFVAASLCCTAMVLWMRPDGENIARGAYDRVATIGTGGLL